MHKTLVWNLFILYYLNHIIYYALFCWINIIFANLKTINGIINFSFAVIFNIL